MLNVKKKKLNVEWEEEKIELREERKKTDEQIS